MAKFIKAKAFEIIMTVLLSVLLGIGCYFVDKLEACEKRIWTLETSTPALAGQRFKNLETKIDGNGKIVKAELDLLKQLVFRLLDASGVDTSNLDTKTGGELEAVVEGRAE